MAWLARWLRPGTDDSLEDPLPPADEGTEEGTADREPSWDEPVELAIDGELDLHHFRPGEVPSLVEAYVRECRARGILELRIMHGKGKSTMRRTVHAVLDRMQGKMAAYRLAPAERGGWGATLVDLEPPM